MQKKIIAIIGRPNVGKSTLFNRIIGKRKAIVHDTPGVTRDRNFGETEWNGKKFFLIDTGGFVPRSADTFESAIREQIKISLEEADIILFVVDAQSGLTPMDMEIAKILRKDLNKKSGSKKIFLIVNKVDNRQTESESSQFYKLGLGEPFDVSALSGRNSGNLLDMITQNILADESEEAEDDTVKFAIIGRPNAGKSSIVNAITQTNRNIVTEIPGTTRDSIDTLVKYYGKNIILIDTAGLRKKSKIKKTESLEYYSTIRTHRSIERCDVAIIIIDAEKIYTKLSTSSDISLSKFKLDKEDIEIILDAAKFRKGILLVINKWDLIQKDSRTAQIFENKVKEHLKTFDYLPFIFVSALTKQRISKILESAFEVYQNRSKEIKTSTLNSKLLEVIKETPPSSKTHKEIKINYITQLKTSPPVIGFFCNNPSEISENYKRFLENKIRAYFDFTGAPLTLVFKRKN